MALGHRAVLHSRLLRFDFLLEKNECHSLSTPDEISTNSPRLGRKKICLFACLITAPDQITTFHFARLFIQLFTRQHQVVWLFPRNAHIAYTGFIRLDLFFHEFLLATSGMLRFRNHLSKATFEAQTKYKPNKTCSSDFDRLMLIPLA